MQERQLKARLTKVKNSINEVVKLKKEADQKRDTLFAEIMSELDQDYDKMVTLVRVAKFELILNDIFENHANDEDDKDWAV
jgi:hypothetical protein